MNSLVEKIYTKKCIDRITNKNKLFGLSKNYNVDDLLLTHLIITMIIIAILSILKINFIIASLIAILYFLGMEYLFFDYRLRKRTNILERESLFYFQILSLNLESGNNLRNAIELASNNVGSNLSYEFRKVIEDVKLGKNLNESLDDLKLRIPSDTINNIILNLVESNILITVSNIIGVPS